MYKTLQSHTVLGDCNKYTFQLRTIVIECTLLKHFRINQQYS